MFKSIKDIEAQYKEPAPVIKHKKAKKILKGIIWFLIVAGIVVFLYLIFSSKFTEGYNALKGQ